MDLKSFLPLLFVFSCFYLEFAGSQRIFENTLERSEQVMGQEIIDFTQLRVRRIRVMNARFFVLQGNFTTLVTIDDKYEAAIVYFRDGRRIPIRIARQKFSSFYNDQLVLPEFKNATNLPQNSPIPQGTYNVNNYEGSMDAVTSNLRSGRYYAEFRLYNGTSGDESQIPENDGFILQWRLYFMLINEL